MPSARFDPKGYVFNTYWEDYNSWGGNQFYDSQIAAQTGAELDYLDEEYSSWLDEPDEGEEPFVPKLSWQKMGRDMWDLYDDGRYTGVHIYMGPVLSLVEV